MSAKTAQTKSVVDLSRSAVSRYIQLASLFRRRIQAGQWQVGAQIPTVEELAAECGVARATIRQALDILQIEGLIERYRAKGTFVRPRPHDQIWCEVATDWSGLLMSRQDAVIEVLVDERGKQPPQVLDSRDHRGYRPMFRSCRQPARDVTCAHRNIARGFLLARPHDG